jgi:hypothetical protein
VQNLTANNSENDAVKSTWHLLTLTQASKRELFYKQVLHAIALEKLETLILSVELPQDSVYKNLVLLEVSSLKAVRDRIQQVDPSLQVKIDPKPLTLAQVNRMLGR